jgi:MFS family permease
MFMVGITLVALSEFGFYLFHEYLGVFAMLVLFFSGFNFLEASMPSLVAKIAPADMKGSAMGLFSASQFMGAFSGGLLGGTMLAYDSSQPAFYELGLLALVWVVIAAFMKNPKAVASRIVSLQDMDESALHSFRQNVELIPGVQEVSVYLEDRMAYLKIDKKIFADEDLNKLLVQS